jgi:hypothetical protein
MKEHLIIGLAAGMLVFATRAQESTPAPGAAASEVEVPKIAGASSEEEAYVALLKNQVELSAQFRLLVGLAQEHRKRAEDAGAAKDGQKAVWETELAKELGDKSDALLKQLSEATKQRQAFEQTHKTAAATLGSLNAATAESRVTPQETEFMNRLTERIERVNQELLAARQSAVAYAMQLQTNTAPFDYQQTAATFEQNGRKVRQLELEASDLELRKLEFLALRRP